MWYLDITMNRVKKTEWCITNGMFRKIVNEKDSYNVKN